MTSGMPEPIDNRVFVLILQHPQERREALATAPLIAAALRHAKVAVGLSWPGLARLVGDAAEPRRWAVLHLGAIRADLADRRELTLLDRHGGPVADPRAILAGLKGIVLLDGTWSQAKTLWWRNPWLLKLHRIVLDPPRPARLGRLRREPRREALSTIEAAALALRHLATGPEAADALDAALDGMLHAASLLPSPHLGAEGSSEAGDSRDASAFPPHPPSAKPRAPSPPAMVHWGRRGFGRRRHP